MSTPDHVAKLLVDKNVVILADDYIPYEYIVNFIATLHSSNIYIVKYPEHIYRYTNNKDNSLSIFDKLKKKKKINEKSCCYKKRCHITNCF